MIRQLSMAGLQFSTEICLDKNPPKRRDSGRIYREIEEIFGAGCCER
jgi:hypothetical protein